MTTSWDKFDKLKTLALHPTTPQEEARTAAFLALKLAVENDWIHAERVEADETEEYVAVNRDDLWAEFSRRYYEGPTTITRNGGPCGYCGEIIPPRTRVRFVTGKGIVHVTCRDSL